MKVIKLNTDGIYGEDEYLIVDDNDIKEGNYCETHDRYGNLVGCYDAGCYSPNNSDSDYKEGDEEAHVQAQFIDYWDGHNWRTFYLDIDGTDYRDGELLDDDDETAKQILAEFKEAEFSQYKQGVSHAETEHYIFSKSQFVNSFWIASVATK